MEADNDNRDYRNSLTKTTLTGDERALGSFRLGDKDRKAVGNIPTNVSHHDSSCGVCSNDDPMEQTLVEVELPMLLVTFYDYYKSSKNCPSLVYPKLEVYRSNLSHATSECYDFLSLFHVDLIDFCFFDVYQDLLMDLLGVAAFQTMAISDRHNLAFFSQEFLTNSLLDVSPNNFHDVAFAIVANTSK